MKRLIHVHSNSKLIIASDFFYGEYFTNEIYLISNEKNTKINYKDKVTILNHSKKSINYLVKNISSADAVIFYDLPLFHKMIINKLPENVKIFWRFFGYEVYHLYNEMWYSELTSIYNIERKKIVHHTYSKVLSKLKKIKWGNYLHFNDIDIYKRINFIICVQYVENELNKMFQFPFPKIIYQPLRSSENLTFISNKVFELKGNSIILGNSRSAYNNHIDIINMINKISLSKYKFILPFNYGIENNYTKHIRKITKNIERYSLIENYLSINDYELLFTKSKALIFNSYRQSGLHSILFAINQGVKLYLSPENTIYHWLKKNNISVYPVEELQNDLKMDSVEYSYIEAENNFNKYNLLVRSYTNNMFQSIINEAV